MFIIMLCLKTELDYMSIYIYSLLISEKKKISQNYNHQKNDRHVGSLGIRRWKIFVYFLQINYEFGVHLGSSSRKTHKKRKC